MTQVFITKEQREETRLESQKQKLLALWNTCAIEYRILPLKYLFLLEEKKRAAIKPLKKIPLSVVMQQYPDIPLFRIFEKEEAEAYILDLVKDGKIDSVVSSIEYTLSSDYALNSLKNWVKETQYVLSKKEYAAAKKAALCQ